MTSQLNVDTIVDKAGSGGSNVKMANTSTYVSDGGAVTQNTVQGLAKHWINLDGDASGVGARDSFNSSSTTDNGTGNYDSSFTNVMSSDSYMVCGTAVANAPISSGRDRIFQAASETTALMNINIFDGSQQDQDLTYGAALGDLA